jgi:hypothetical protein
MAAGFLTPTHLLVVLAALAVFLVWRGLARRSARPARRGRGRAVDRIAGWRVRRPTRAQAHVAWLLVSALIAFAFTRAAALPLFLVVFFAVWLCGYGVLVRLFR